MRETIILFIKHLFICGESQIAKNINSSAVSINNKYLLEKWTAK